MKCPNCGEVHPGKICPKCNSGISIQGSITLKFQKLNRNKKIFTAVLIISILGGVISSSIKSSLVVLFGVLAIVSIIGIIKINQQLSQNYNDVFQNNIPISVPQVTQNDIVVPDQLKSNSCTSENHHITGTSYYKKNIQEILDKFGVPNPWYTTTKNELIDSEMVEERIYSLEDTVIDATLLEEPDNPYDSNAIKVIIDEYVVGYIKRGSCSHVKKILHSGIPVKTIAKIYGGEYKYLSSEWDDEKEEYVYQIEKNRSDYGIILSIQYDTNQ